MKTHRAIEWRRAALTATIAGLVIFSLFTALVQPGTRAKQAGTLLATPAYAEAKERPPAASANEPGTMATLAANEESTAGLAIFKPDPLATLAESLKEKEAELDAREKALKKKEEYLEALRKETASNLARIEELYNKLERQSIQAQQKRDKDLAKWRSIYQSMTPEKAGPIVAGMETELALELLSQMDPKKAAKILAMIEPSKAVELTKRLGTSKKP